MRVESTPVVFVVEDNGDVRECVKWMILRGSWGLQVDYLIKKYISMKIENQ